MANLTLNVVDSVPRIDDFIRKIRKIKCSVALSDMLKLNNQETTIEEKEVLLNKAKRSKKSLDAIELVCSDEIMYLLRNLKINSVHNTITRYRNVINDELTSNHIALFYLKLPKEFYEKRNHEYTQKVKQRGNHRIPFKRANVERYIERLIWLTQQDSYIAIAMGIAGLTGRRPSEVLLTAQFSTALECKYTDNSLIFKGQLKTNEDSESARDNYEIPVLCDDEQIVINALAKLRAMKDFSKIEPAKGQTIAQRVNSLTAKGQKECVQRYLSEFFGDKINPYVLRALYAEIAKERYILKEQAPNEFFSEVLGHSKDDEGTFASYQWFFLSND